MIRSPDFAAAICRCSNRSSSTASFTQRRRPAVATVGAELFFHCSDYRIPAHLKQADAAAQISDKTVGAQPTWIAQRPIFTRVDEYGCSRF